MTELFAATRRSRDLIGRDEEMRIIREAIFPGDDSCRIIFIKGRGGFGKTRLLEETLRRLGVPRWREMYPLTDEHRAPGPDWQDFGKVVPTDIVDLIDTRLHARNRFLQEVRESLRWAQGFIDFNFNNYDAALEEHKRRLLDNVEYRLVQEAAQKAEAAFWADYGELTRTRRAVWVIDTAEQLNVIASQWLIDKNLLTDVQLQFQTQKWLAAAVRKGLFRNTTLLLAGRDKEGEKFFEAIEKAAREAGAVTHAVEAQSFTEDEIGQYYHTLETEWRTETEDIAEALKALAESPAHLRLLHDYTGGQPVRLALFSDLLIESRSIPDALRIPAADAGALSEAEKEFRQWQLEEEVVSLLFQQPWIPPSGAVKSAEEAARRASLRREILLALVRARLGLSAKQLHFVIDNVRDLPPDEWKKKEADPKRLREIEETMQALRELSIVKNRPTRVSLAPNGEERESTRLGLQDEVYRIFAEHMAPHVILGSPADDSDREDRARLERVLAWRKQEDPQALKRYAQNHKDETEARKRLYTLLRDWANHERGELREELKKISEEEEHALEVELYRVTPAAPRSARFRLPEEDEQRRLRYRQAVRELDLEHMHYAFSLDPDRELNNAYFDLADDRWMAYDEDADILTQAEMWRILYDRHALKFVEWTTRKVTQERGEETIDVLRRAAQQEDATRWIKRLTFRGNYVDAIQLADSIEAYIAQMPGGNDKQSWQHTFAQSERLCWQEFARMLPGQGSEVFSAIGNLESIVAPLERLAHADTNTLVSPEKGEWGFMGHPAYIRLKRVISTICANIAYGYTQLGHFRQAVEYFGKALSYIRETGADAHRALVLNNLSRALAELGRQRALRICQDGLELRKSLGADAPIGLSHSTLALIQNYQNNPDRAWIEAAKAVLLFQRIEYPRGRGLASIQLADALRRLAAQARAGRALPATPQELHRAAEDALNDALGIFIRHTPSEEEKAQGKVQEPLRWIEARIEKGCLYRDRLRTLQREKSRDEWRHMYSTARGLLQEAAKEAASGWARLELDARVNLAWTHYAAGEPQEAEKAIEECQALIGRIIGRNADLITENQPLPGPRDVEAYIYYQLSKLHGLRGRMAMERFTSWVETFQKALRYNNPGISRAGVHQEVAKELERNPHHLDLAADAYLVAVAYAQLYSPRSTALSMRYDSLYSYLKKFNQVELDAFRRHAHQHHLTRRGEKGETLMLEDLGDVEEFLRESLGLAMPVAG
jgi:hypothetical protein